MNVLPFRIIGETQVKEFQRLLEQAINSWQKEWFAEEFRTSVNIKDTDFTSLKDDWLLLEESQELWIAWRSSSEAVHCLAAALFNTTAAVSKPGELAKELFKECVSDFSRGFINDLQTERVSSLKGLRTGYGSGALQTEIQGAFSHQHIIFSGGVVEKLLCARRGHEVNYYNLVKRESAIENYKAVLEVTVGKAEITLADLANIDIGDVIQLDTSIKQSFAVHTQTRISIANGQLGIFNNHKAVQLI